MSLRDESRSADDWPASPDIDEFTWELGPDPDDARWLAEQNESWDADDPVPDEVLDRQAEEVRIQGLLDLGLSPF